jgi:hypothetical protein
LCKSFPLGFILPQGGKPGRQTGGGGKPSKKIYFFNARSLVSAENVLSRPWTLKHGKKPDCVFDNSSPSPSPKEERAGVRRLFVRIIDSLIPCGAVGES